MCARQFADVSPQRIERGAGGSLVPSRQRMLADVRERHPREVEHLYGDVQAKPQHRDAVLAFVPAYATEPAGTDAEFVDQQMLPTTVNVQIKPPKLGQFGAPLAGDVLQLLRPRHRMTLTTRQCGAGDAVDQRASEAIVGQEARTDRPCLACELSCDCWR